MTDTPWEWPKPKPAPTAVALPCRLCGGKFETKYYEGYSCDSSFDYVGCADCDISFMDEDEITDEVIARWNKLMC